METREGPLILADISGYTAFVAQTEIEHSQEILTELLQTIIGAVTPSLSVAQLEGDAVFCLGEESGPELPDLLERTFVAYQRQLRDIQVATMCPCRACASVGSLSLKFVVHRGPYRRHRIGGIEQVFGADVNVAHRLAKNHVPSREYILATAPALAAWTAERRAEFAEHAEEYGDTGPIACGYKDLEPLRREALAERRLRVLPEEARLRYEIALESSRAEVWWAYNSPEGRRIWMAPAGRVEIRPGARRTLQGAEYHCHHGRGVSVSRVVHYEEPFVVTSVGTQGDLPPEYLTAEFDEIGPERTAVRVYVDWDTPPGPEGAEYDQMCKRAYEEFFAVVPDLLRQALVARRSAIASAG